MESVVSENIQNKSGDKLQQQADRQKTCPVLLRVFVNKGRHNLPTSFHRGNVPENELQIHTWMDVSLKELTNLIRALHPEARRRGTMFEFAVIYPHLNPPLWGYRMRDLGVTTQGRAGPDDNNTLAGLRVQIGDFIDVVISHSRPLPVGGGGGYGGGGRGGGGGGFGRGGFRDGGSMLPRNRGRPY